MEVGLVPCCPNGSRTPHSEYSPDNPNSISQLFETGDFGRGNVFVGWEQYRRLFGDSQAWQALLNTVRYTVLVVPLAVMFGLAAAVQLNGQVRGRSFFRTLYFVPMIATPAAVTMVWKWLYNEHFGLINVGLRQLGFSGQAWTVNPSLAPFSIALIGIWTSLGYCLVLFLAGLQEIPYDYYEASEIDGASRLRQFFSITLPLLSPTMFFVTVTLVIQSMQVFDLVFMMVDVTNPAYETTVSLVYLFYNNSFKYFDKGYGSVLVMLLLFTVMVVTVFQIRLQKRWTDQT